MAFPVERAFTGHGTEPEKTTAPLTGKRKKDWGGQRMIECRCILLGVLKRKLLSSLPNVKFLSELL